MKTRLELLTEIAQAAAGFRRTAIVEQDFTFKRDALDRLLTDLITRQYVHEDPTFATDQAAELARARKLHPRPTASAHEGYGVILEELDELWDQVKLKASRRDHKNMYEECIQVAAMAQKMAEDLKLKA